MPSGGGSSSSSSGAQALSSLEGRAPHEVGGLQAEYQIVIPTRGRWRPACEISPERALKHERRPFIIVKTLAFLQKQAIPQARVTIYVADVEEEQKYKVALSRDDYWRDTQICVGKPGIREQRNYIVNSLPEGTHVVSLDDDVSDIKWKHRAGSFELQSLPEGVLERLIFHAYATMRKHKAFIWGLNTSMNPLSMWTDGISTRNGEVNGFCYGFINRHLRQLQPQIADATEDAERSLRFFRKDGVVLRYRMYAGVTKCFKYAQGLQELFPGSSLTEKNKARKEAERAAVEEILNRPEFSKQAKKSKPRTGVQTLEITFLAIGGSPLPITTADALKEANRKDTEGKNPSAQQKEGGAQPRKKQRTSETGIETSKGGDDEAKQGQSIRRRSPATPLQSKGSEDEDDEEHESTDEEGQSENRAFESVLQQLQRGQRSEEDAIQQAMQNSIQEMVHLFNGDVEDPVGLAKQNSMITLGEEKQRQAEEQEAADFAFAMSLQEEPSPQDALPVTLESSSSGAVSQQSHNEEASDSSFDHGLARLVEMNFDPGQAADCLQRSCGDVEQAISMLLVR